MKRTLALILAVLLAAVHVSFAEEYEQSGCWTKMYVQDEFGDPTGEAFFVAEADGTCTSLNNLFGAPIKAMVMVASSLDVGLLIYDQDNNILINTSDEAVSYTVKVKDGSGTIHTVEKGGVMEAGQPYLAINCNWNDINNVIRLLIAGGKVQFSLSSEYAHYSLTLKEAGGVDAFLPVLNMQFYDENGVSIVQKGRYSYGLMGANGKLLTPCQYIYIEYIGSGRFAVLKDFSIEEIDASSDEKIPFYGIYESWIPKDSVKLSRWPYPKFAGRHRKYTILDETGNECLQIIQNVDYYSGHLPRFHDGLMSITIDGKTGFIDTNGNIVIPCKYDTQDEDGFLILDYDLYQFSEGLSSVCLDGKYGYIDTEGNEVIPCKFDRALNFKNGVATVWMEGKKYTIDKDGKFVDDKEIASSTLEPQSASDFIVPEGYFINEWNDELAIISTEAKPTFISKCGVINKAGDFVIPCEIAYGIQFAGDYLILGRRFEYYFDQMFGHSSCGIADREGNILYPQEYSIVYNAGNFYLVDKHGNLTVLDGQLNRIN